MLQLFFQLNLFKIMNSIGSINSLLSGRSNAVDAYSSVNRWPTSSSYSLQDLPSPHEATAAIDAGHALVWRDQHAEFRAYREAGNIVLDRRMQKNMTGMPASGWELLGRYTPQSDRPLVSQTPDQQAAIFSFYNSNSAQNLPVYQLRLENGNWSVLPITQQQQNANNSSGRSGGSGNASSNWGEEHQRTTKEMALRNGWSPVYLDFLR